MKQRNYPDLQIDEDAWQQRWEWALEPVVWFFLYAILLGIMLGLLGQGPLSEARLEASDPPMQMEYSRFMRYKSPEQLKITVPASSPKVRIMLDKRYVAHLEINRVSPEPEKVIAQAEGRVFVFNAEPSRPIQVDFHIRPQKPGTLEGWVAIDDGARQPFSQFVYP